jgi:hypothetical protein
VRDAALGSGTPLDECAEPAGGLDGPACLAGFSLAGNGDLLHPEIREPCLDARLAVAAVGRDRFRPTAEERLDAGDRRHEHLGVGRVALEHGQVEHDAVDVVGDLSFVPEFHRFAEPAFGDRAGVGVVQRDDPSRPVRDLT